jgi:Bax protein
MRIIRPMTTRPWKKLTRRHLQMSLFLFAIACLLTLLIKHSNRTASQAAKQPLPELSEEPPDERKRAFFAYLRPLVEQQNAEILERRRMLESMAEQTANGEPLSFRQQRHLLQVAKRYRIDTEDKDWSRILETALRRVDRIPESLVLAQAAKESGWGTSRFAQQANNLFGEWCFTPGCGLVPQNRRDGHRHEVRRFDSVADSVRSYFLNLNRHERYRAFRLKRAEFRQIEAALNGWILADELRYYSERREEYVTDIKNLILHNDLESAPPETVKTDEVR